jgi:hypothetical protein
MKPILVLLLTLASTAFAATVDQEVDYLLGYVAISGCTFIRNDSPHEPADAADHLRNKYKRGRRWVDSAEQFIDRIASGSSLSGKPYRVTCGNTEMDSGEWLHGALDQYRAPQQPGRAPVADSSQ